MKKTYAKCRDCGREMRPGNGCSIGLIEFPDGKTAKRVKFGVIPPSDGWADDADSVCGDCNAGVGQYHHFGCDVERCPLCGLQLIGCDCSQDPDAVDRYYQALADDIPNLHEKS